MTAAEVYESVTNGGTSDFADVAAILNRHKPWCLIGGLAVNCYVEPVYTIDVDLVVVATNLSQIQRALEAQHLESKLNIQFITDARYKRFSLGGKRGRSSRHPDGGREFNNNKLNV